MGKRGPVKPRCLNCSPDACHRRQKRQCARENREHWQKDARQRPGSRAAKCGQCSRFKTRCACWASRASAVDKKAWKAFQASVASAQLLTLADTDDCGPFVAAYKSSQLSRLSLLRLSAMYRYFSRAETWEALLREGAVPGPTRRLSPPSQQMIEKVLRNRLDQKLELFGGGRRPLVGRARQQGSSSSGSSSAVDGAGAKAKGHAHALMALWSAGPAANALSTASQVESAVAQFYDDVREKLSGLMGPYFLKCVLGCFVSAAGLPQETYARAVLGYESAVDRLFPSGAPEGNVLLWVNLELKRSGRTLTLPESSGQLCWWGRRDDGLLQDSQVFYRRGSGLSAVSDAQSVLGRHM